ncbi:DegT/DnrJ/EryC1/StrS family aminotransferase [Chryseobacterium indologenes]|uniref:DegT/DnrJ/EryC1/StrS family aminotransferase n=2 Tax=Chryseobacterium indologenes TaxID=253 RepID=A0AAD0Z060_CHRID|nr:MULTISPECIES: DegT/DnrJ/EryC1/StrS family aminotransferase [Chryseobacterium]ASE62446.1 DegT/DnrJ/EryC1/StrS family aminotransferase [Chryseobacterium indologenes]ATN06279.1 DegT/DnrJ/EryC1/StrS family aminotransferase [Chryseobacterium indologenes]AYZ34629.1 DegT/DnrJ/EryC1/StrS family aminotransferase [Chryseobacterium indologenes]AZB18159.1 DegT/DnrJ/EryC1/StrS family aminotransferase [Chryseobacterium indologenes]MBF6643206.1 DegT/DnrJ/EryC1/StrS family aminotransferase [Chryseobacteriu
MKIQMVDLKNQYEKIKEEVNAGIQNCLDNTAFINGPAVKEFQQEFEKYLGVKHVIPCANGTDALQIAMMALDLKPGDEIICPAFTYVATAEVMGLLGLKPIMVDVNENTFDIELEGLEKYITPNTKAIVPVHLYGQSADMEKILAFAQKHNLFVIEDNAQAIGSDYTFSDGTVKKTGTIGHIGCTSFFPSKNLGCYGDGGALMTNDDDLALKIRMIANHGQEKKYYHKVLGCNSRLDTIQAAVLKVKLKHLDEYSTSRNKMATYYDENLAGISDIEIPARAKNSTHVFHQYTLKVKNGKRDELQKFLGEKNIPSMIYYPLPLYKQEAFQQYVTEGFTLPVTEKLCSEVISLPIHTEFDKEASDFIISEIKNFFN